LLRVILQHKQENKVKINQMSSRRVKLAPHRPPHKSHSDMFVGYQSNECVLYKRAKKLLDRQDLPSITIHGLGGV
jgi:hypothetical protein